MNIEVNMNDFYFVDLHIHSCYSENGEYTPAELIQMCKDAGVRMMAISDHNCVKGSKEAMDKAKCERIRCYSAIEIDCTFKDINFQVLGYDIKLDSPDFECIEQNIRKQYVNVSKKRLRLIKQMGFDLTETDLSAVTDGRYWSEHWTGKDFAEALLTKDKYLECDLLRPYRENGNRSDNPYVNFQRDYFLLEKPCYVVMTYPDMRDVIDIIHRNGGKSVLAHPGISLKGNFEMIDQLVPLGLNGIEAYSSYHTPETAKWFCDKVKQFDLFFTRGSNFLGKARPMIKLGYCSAVDQT